MTPFLREETSAVSDSGPDYTGATEPTIINYHEMVCSKSATAQTLRQTVSPPGHRDEQTNDAISEPRFPRGVLGAACGNRTRTICLEGRCSTFKLRPQNLLETEPTSHEVWAMSFQGCANQDADHPKPHPQQKGNHELSPTEDMERPVPEAQPERSTWISQKWRAG